MEGDWHDCEKGTSGQTRQKKQMNRQWNHEQASQEEYWNSVWLCKDGIKKAKANLEQNLTQVSKNNKKDFYKYISQKNMKKG